MEVEETAARLRRGMLAQVLALPCVSSNATLLAGMLSREQARPGAHKCLQIVTFLSVAFADSRGL